MSTLPEDQPFPGMPQPVTPERRAEIIAGLRAIAQFLEDRPEIPSPQSVSVQHSFIEPLNTNTWERIPVPDAEKVAYVQRVADLLGAEAEVYEGGTAVTYAVAAHSTYTVHAKLRGDKPEGGAA